MIEKIMYDRVTQTILDEIKKIYVYTDSLIHWMLPLSTNCYTLNNSFSARLLLCLLISFFFVFSFHTEFIDTCLSL